MFVGQNALIIAIKAANWPPDMQLQTNKETNKQINNQTTNNQGIGSGEVG